MRRYIAILTPTLQYHVFAEDSQTTYFFLSMTSVALDMLFCGLFIASSPKFYFGNPAWGARQLVHLKILSIFSLNPNQLPLSPQ
jgi:hypothetical protein